MVINNWCSAHAVYVEGDEGFWLVLGWEKQDLRKNSQKLVARSTTWVVQ